jgi:hypothetical protein
MSTQLLEETLEAWERLDQFEENHPQFKENQLRWIYRNREANGAAHLFRKIGKPIYINVPGFGRWLAARASA